MLERTIRTLTFHTSWRVNFSAEATMQKRSTFDVLGCSGSIGIPKQGISRFLIDFDPCIHFPVPLVDRV